MIHVVKSCEVYVTDPALTFEPTYKLLSPPEIVSLHYTISINTRYFPYCPFRFKEFQMNANPKFLNSEAEIDQASTSSFPNSRKVYAAGSTDDIRVPMREVRQSSTAGVEGNEETPPFLFMTHRALIPILR